MAAQDSDYTNTDLDLRSNFSIETLAAELEQSCHVMFCTHGDDGRWYATIESAHDWSAKRDAAQDIASMLAALSNVSDTAKAEFQNCDRREFNIGFDCWDSWGYNHALPHSVVQGIADAGCTLSITLYPMRNPDGTPKVVRSVN